MVRLIDIDRLCNDLAKRWSIADKKKEDLIRAVMADVVTPIVVSQPTVDAVPVRHGRWKHKKDLKQFFCDQCGEPSLTEDDVYFYGMEFPNFCPNCGADMREDGGNG